MIVTGQQPAVGGGPLYTLIKVAHAVALGRARGMPVLFWCASEDHDIGEANHADIITRDGSIHRWTADLGPGRASLRFRPCDGWWLPLMSRIEALCGPGLGRDFLIAYGPMPGEGIGSWQCRLLQSLFPGLQAVEAHVLRPRWATVLPRVLDSWPAASLAELRQGLLATGALDAFGALDAPPLFADRPEGRIAVTPEEARRLITTDPGIISPGAALRPVLQQVALPCVTYVGGPGELAYHRFLAPIYPALGVAAPELLPRCSMTILPSWFTRACRNRGVAVEDVEKAVDPTVDDSGLLQAYDDLVVRVAAVDGLAGMVRILERERRRLERSMRRVQRRRQGAVALGSLRAWMRPRGKPQERSLGVVQAIWEWGPGLARILTEAAACSAPGEHRYITL